MRSQDASHACPFCNQHYSRRDALKRHYPRCPNRNGPSGSMPNLRKGRTRHSCHECSRRKLFCDGQERCSSCLAKNIPCTKHPATGVQNSAVPTNDREPMWKKQCADAFLLSDKYEEVMSKFNFPRPVEDNSGEFTSTARRWEASHDPMLPSASIIQSPLEMDFNFIDGMFEWDLFLPTPEDVSGFEGESKSYIGSLADDPGKLSRIKDGIMEVAMSHQLGECQRIDLRLKLDRILTTSRTNACLTCYFRGWHRNCRVIHAPTFSAGSVHDGLLAAMIFLGAAYSPSSEMRRLAGDVIDHVESYIFAQAMLASEESRERGIDKRCDFQVFQSGFLMVVIQFWTGNPAAKMRAATTRFSSLVQTARTMALFSVSQELEDRSSENMWILKESQIRTTAYVVLLDCALLFFKGIPLRILTSEIDCNLPCDELTFEAEHPFTDPGFSQGRVWNTRTAFSALFDSRIEAREVRRDFTVLDTFILIHMLYRFVNDVLTVSLCRQDRLSATYAEDSLTIEAVRALDRWHRLWVELRDHAKQHHQWEELGFFKNGDQYEAATRLLLSDEARPGIRQLLAADSDRLVLLQSLHSRTTVV